MPEVVTVVNVTKPIIIISIVILGLSLGGFAIVAEIARKLVASTPNFDIHLLSAMVIAAMATIMIVDVMLAWLLARLINASLRAGSFASTKELPAPTPNARQINAPRDYVSSVTEQTTRTLEPAYREPRA
jgi:hypothetical protein